MPISAKVKTSTSVLALCLLLLAGVVSLACGGRYSLDGEMLVNTNPRWAPQWSPDGQYILFADNVWANDGDIPSNTYGYRELSTLYLVTPTGTNIRVLSDHGDRDPKRVDISPDFSPDGTKVVYATTRHGRGAGVDYKGCHLTRVFDLEVVEVDGFKRRLLDTNPGRQYWDVAPAWSPDGSTIAFARSSICDTEEFGIYAINSDGSDVRLVAGFGGYDRWAYHEAGPVWSPSGRALAFVARVPTADASPWTPAMETKREQWEIVEKADYFKDTRQPQQHILYIVKADGTKLQALYAAGDHRTDAIVGPPAWSPDGSQMAFATLRYSQSAGYSEQFPPVHPSHREQVIHGLTLFTIAPDGSGLFRVAEKGVDQLHPAVSLTGTFALDWSPDGAAILLSDGYSTEVWSASGAGLEARIQGSYGTWSPDGSRIAVMNVGAERPGGTVVLSTVSRQGEQPRILVRERVERRLRNEFLEAEYSPDNEPLHQFE